MPKALYAGLSPEQFWYEEPYLLDSYAKAYELKIKENAEEWKIKTNFSAWLNGAYIQNAITSVFSQNHHYPRKPFEIFATEENPKDKLQSSEEAIKQRSKVIHQMLNRK